MIPKFRCWDEPNKIMRSNDEIVMWNGQVYINEKKELDSKIKGFSCLPEHLMQTTGLKDINGVEIFEGDLVEHEDNINGHWETFEACEVVYDKDCAQFCFKDDAGNFLTDYRNLNVIGNIYENPDLLERS